MAFNHIKIILESKWFSLGVLFFGSIERVSSNWIRTIIVNTMIELGVQPITVLITILLIQCIRIVWFCNRSIATRWHQSLSTSAYTSALTSQRHYNKIITLNEINGSSVRKGQTQWTSLIGYNFCVSICILWVLCFVWWKFKLKLNERTHWENHNNP